jgi:hypothetical protein
VRDYLQIGGRRFPARNVIPRPAYDGRIEWWAEAQTEIMFESGWHIVVMGPRRPEWDDVVGRWSIFLLEGPWRGDTLHKYHPQVHDHAWVKTDNEAIAWIDKAAELPSPQRELSA